MTREREERCPFRGRPLVRVGIVVCRVGARCGLVNNENDRGVYASLLFRRFLGQIVRFRGAAEHACGVFLYRGGEVG